MMDTYVILSFLDNWDHETFLHFSPHPLTFVLHMVFFYKCSLWMGWRKINPNSTKNIFLTDLDRVKTIRREISSNFYNSKTFGNIIYLCVFVKKILKNAILIKKSNFRLRKTCVWYRPCEIFITLRDRELNHVLLNKFWNERKWNIQDGGLKPEVDTAKRLFPFPHLIATQFQRLYLC